VRWDDTRVGISTVMEDMEKRGITDSALYKELKKFSQGTEKTYNDLDKFEKKLTKLARNSEYTPDIQNLQPYIDKDWSLIGKNAPKVKKEFLLKNGVSQKTLDLIGDKDRYTVDELRKISAGEFKDLLKLSNLIKPKGSRRGFNEVQFEKGYIKSLFTPNNKELLTYIRETSPETFNELKHARLNLVFREMTERDQFSAKPLKDYLRQNQQFLKESYGTKSYEALQNFSTYLEDSQELIREASRSDRMAGQLGVEVGAATLFGAYKESNILANLILAETAGGIISRALSDPNSFLFKVMTGKTPQAISRALDEAGRGLARKYNLDDQLESATQNTMNKIFQVGPQGAFK